MSTSKVRRLMLILLPVALFALVVTQWQQLFSMSEVVSRDKVQAQVLTSKRHIITRSSPGGKYSINQYRLTLTTHAGHTFQYYLDDTLLKGHAPVIGEWLVFTRLTRASGAYDFLIADGALAQRLIMGPQLKPGLAPN